MPAVCFANALARVACAACLTVALTGGGPGEAQTPTAVDLYRRALVVMNDLPEPAFVSARVEGEGDGAHATLTRQGGCDHIQLAFGSGTVRWTMRNRAHDPATEIEDLDDGQRYVSTAIDRDTGHRFLSSLDPTWASTYRALRAPLVVQRFRCAPPPASVPQPVESPPSDSALKVIGTVAAIGPGIYNIEDRGGATCRNGDAGRALHLWSRTRNPNQTLSDVVIDLASMRLCTVRFGVRRGAGLGVDSVVEQHFAEVGKYWVQTDGSIEVTARVVGIAASHGVFRYRFVDMQFPDTMPPETFAPVAQTGALAPEE